jgi:hypothetical protein
MTDTAFRYFVVLSFVVSVLLGLVAGRFVVFGG